MIKILLILFLAATANAQIISGEAEYNLLYVEEKIGIATTDPNVELDVVGDVSVSNTVIAEYIMPRKAWHAFGGFQDEAETIDLSSMDYEQITNITNDLWSGLESDGITLTNDTMTIENTGDYIGAVSLSFSGGNGKDYFIRIYNKTQTRVEGYHIGRTGSGNTNFGNAMLPIYIEATAGDELEMQMQGLDGTAGIMRSAIFWLTFLHD